MRSLTEIQRRYNVDYFRAAEIQEIERERDRLSIGWSPIDTAPKSGAPVLLWWQRCKAPAIGRWVDDETGTGWVCDGDQCMPKNQDDCTHWMPLPPSGPRMYVPDMLDRERDFEAYGGSDAT